MYLSCFFDVIVQFEADLVSKNGNLRVVELQKTNLNLVEVCG